jgi:hypothetical protein
VEGGCAFQCLHQSHDLPDLSLFGQSDMDLTFLMLILHLDSGNFVRHFHSSMDLGVCYYIWQPIRMTLDKMPARSGKCLLSALFGQNGGELLCANVETILKICAERLHKFCFLIGHREHKIRDVGAAIAELGRDNGVRNRKKL